MRRIAHGVAAVGLSALGLGLFAFPAAAHVTVQPPTATKGGYATMTFKVPNERDAANTTQLEVEFPEAYPFAGISVQPVAGWDYVVEKANLPTPISNHGEQISQRVSKITWTADSPGSQIKPGEFLDFPVSAGPLPADAPSMTFKALQTYSNGEIVRWIEEAAAGAAEPRYPAPKLTLTDAAPAGGTSVTAAPASGDVSAAVAEARAAADEARKAVAELNARTMTSTSATASDAPTKNQVNTAVGLAIGAIVLALIGAGIGGAALARRPREEDAPPPPMSPNSPPPAF